MPPRCDGTPGCGPSLQHAASGSWTAREGSPLQAREAAAPVSPVWASAALPHRSRAEPPSPAVAAATPELRADAASPQVPPTALTARPAEALDLCVKARNESASPASVLDLHTRTGTPTSEADLDACAMFTQPTAGSPLQLTSPDRRYLREKGRNLFDNM